MVNNYKFAQLQPFTLYGAGAVAGATTVTLKSFTTIAGVALAMTDFGTIGFGTIEPGNGKLEEQISFTGVTPNANGTATLTGVKTVLNIYPYTQTSGLAQTHAGSTSFVISNTAGFYDQMVAKNDDATITGLYTFDVAQFPKMSDATTMPTDQAQLATKAYADQVIAGGAPDATTSVQGKVQLATQAQTDAKTPTGSTGAALVTTPDHQRSTLLSDYVADTGAADAYVITPAPAITAYTAGQIFTFKATNTNTTTSTINVNGLGVKTIKKYNGNTNVVAGDIVANKIYEIEYDGTNFQLRDTAQNNMVPSASGNINKFLTSTDGVAPAFGSTVDIQTFTASGTWTKPTNAQWVQVIAYGAGGGGCSGHTNGTVSDGGGGGGARVSNYFKASDLSSTVTVTVGTGGSGGSGNASGGTAGGNTTFGAYLTAIGGSAGASIQGGNGGGITAPQSGNNGISGQYGAGTQGAVGGFAEYGGGGGSGSTTSSIYAAGSSYYGAGGGGGGGTGVATNATAGTGGAGGASLSYSAGGGGAGGAGGTGAGNNSGSAGTAGVTGTVYNGGTGGGGGGGASGSATGGIGGAGGAHGGGGGGGGSAGGGTSGNGGAGGAGACYVIAYF